MRTCETCKADFAQSGAERSGQTMKEQETEKIVTIILNKLTEYIKDVVYKELRVHNSSDRWITLKNGKHILLKDSESIKEAIDEKENKNKNKNHKETIPNKEIARIQKGKPMSRDKANRGNVNPNFGKGIDDYGYSNNCQSCIACFEARLKGYNVEVLPYSNQTANIMFKLSRNPQLVYIDEKTNKPPELLFDFNIKNSKNLIKWLDKEIEPNQRFAFAYQHKNGGHIIEVDKPQEGKLRFYDPQIGKNLSAEFLNEIIYEKYKNNIIKPTPPIIFRVDNKKLDLKILQKITKNI